MNRKAKIVVTLGPNSKSEEAMEQFILAGMDVARINFSHGTYSEHEQQISILRKISKKLNKPVPILQDLQGPRLRVGHLPQGSLDLAIGQEVILANPDEIQPQKTEGLPFIPLHIPDFDKIVKTGNPILLDDGRLELIVTSIFGELVKARVILGGMLKSNKGINLPQTELNIPGFTDKDRRDLEFGLRYQVDAIAISFISSAMDIQVVRKAVLEINPEFADIPIIGKLERPQALTNLHEILQAADGVMVARGDLAIETSPAAVPIAQKMVIQEANRNAKVVITATQMLDSMMNNPRPTRAEASDVANAILDGTDAVMLSGETSVGNYPLESIRMMDSIIREAEHHFYKWGSGNIYPVLKKEEDVVTITEAARQLAEDKNVAIIAVFTVSGRTARLTSKERVQVPIFAFTPNPRTFNRLGMYWNVIPFLIPFADTVEKLLGLVEDALFTTTYVKSGDQVLVISGFPVGTSTPPNFALLHTIN